MDSETKAFLIFMVLPALYMGLRFYTIWQRNGGQRGR